jgi:uncharacterized delta-60 repeat protein
MFTPFAFIQPITTVTPIAPTLNYLLIGGSFSLYNAPVLNRMVKIDENGNIDGSFNIGTGFGNNTYDIKQQPDGKYIVGGNFTSYSGSSVNYLTRLNHNGTRDTSLNIGTGFNSVVFSVSPQSDNSNIVVGAFTSYSGSASNRIVRINTDGTRDTTFNIGTGFNTSGINTIITQADGKPIIGGSFTQYSSSNNYITRTDLSGSYNAGPETNFNMGVGFNNSVYTYATQSDGKILVGGSFTQYSGSGTNTTRIIRLNSNGTQDTSFVTGVGFNTDVHIIKIQTDGKIIVGGLFTTYSGSTVNYITRLNSNGTRDTTFNTGTAASSTVWDSHIQSDGKIVIVGGFATYSGSSNPGIVRINDSGSKDTTFNVGLGTTGAVYSINPTGSQYIVGGNFTSYSGSSNNYIVRINSNGTKDTSFNIGTGFSSTVNDTTVEPNGKILAIGQFTTYSGSSTNTTRIIRLNPDGTQDTTFVTGTGLNQVTPNGNHLSIELDGKIYVGSQMATYSGSTVNFFARINPSGTLDTTFNGYESNPAYAVGFNNVTRTIFISGSNIYFGGSYIAYKPTNQIIRLNTNGTQDTTFSLGVGIAGGSSTIYSLVSQSDGKIIAVGAFSTYQGVSQNNITRINTNGTIDTTFNVGTGFNNTATSATVQPDGKIVVMGLFNTYSGSVSTRIIRLNPSGTLDTTFNVGAGIDTVNSTAGASKIISTPDNKIYATTVGMTTYSGSSIGNLVKINSSGSIDTTFGTTSSFSFNNTGRGLYNAFSPGGYTLIPSGSSVIVGGSFITYKNTAFLNGGMIDTTGAISSSFNIGAGFPSTVLTWATQSDGKILVGGSFSTYSGSSSACIARINTNGTRDTTFNVGAGFNNVVADIRIQSDGKIIATGQFTTYSGSSTSGIVRLNTNGTRDTTFNVGTGFTTTVDAKHCKIQSDGKIVVVGGFTTYSGSTSNRIVRINTDGTRDTTFNIGTGFGSTVEAAIIQSDGKIVTTGQYQSYSGSVQNYITRINTNGTRDTTFNIGTGLTNVGFALALQSDGKIICTSGAQTYSGSTNRYIIRINTSGTLDDTFNANAITSLSFTSNTANSLTIDSNGKIYWGNQFTTFSGSFTPNRIVRLNTNGSVDETFNQAFPNYPNNTGKGANSTVNAILLL